MATISNPVLTVTGLTATTVRVLVTYSLLPSPVEKLAGTVFTETIQLIGDDPGVVGDTVIIAFPPDSFAVSSTTPAAGVARTRSRSVSKSAMNEDPVFLTTGAEETDETFARITLVYAASGPTPPTLPSPASTAPVVGAWK